MLKSAKYVKVVWQNGMSLNIVNHQLIKLQEGETVVEKHHRTLLHETKNNNTPDPIAQNITIQSNNIIQVILNLPIPPNSW